jgi:hypothetical protein
MSIDLLLNLDVTKHIEKKGKLSYLSWAWAWTEAIKADPKATYKIEMFDGKCYMDINGTAMVFVTVTIFDKPMTCQLPVMNYKNEAIKNPDAFDINTAIMRCMTKALALHGLGMHIYAGEDLPDPNRKGPGPIITPKSDVQIPEEEKVFLREMAASCEELVGDGNAEGAYKMVLEAALEVDQQTWLWSQLAPSTRAAIKKAKGN